MAQLLSRCPCFEGKVFYEKIALNTEETSEENKQHVSTLHTLPRFLHITYRQAKHNYCWERINNVKRAILYFAVPLTPKQIYDAGGKLIYANNHSGDIFCVHTLPPKDKYPWHSRFKSIPNVPHLFPLHNIHAHAPLSSEVELGAIFRQLDAMFCTCARGELFAYIRVYVNPFGLFIIDLQGVLMLSSAIWALFLSILIQNGL